MTITTLVLVIILSVIGVNCGPSGPPQYVKYTDDANGFSIDYPEGWHVEHPKEPAELKVAIWSKKWGTDRAAIMVAKESVPGLSLEAYSKLRIQHLSDTDKDYAPVLTEELTISGIPAIKHTYTSTVGQTSYTSVQVYLVENGTGWVFGFVCPQKSFDSYRPIRDTAFNGFRLL